MGYMSIVVTINMVRIGAPPSGEEDTRPVARLPEFLPLRGWTADTSRKGYLRYSSRSKTSGVRKNQRAHRVVVEKLMGKPLDESIHVHHQDFDKLNCSPFNLIAMPAAFNPSCARRDPYTGEFMTTRSFERRYGESYAA
jgi:hypothetical protein